MKYRIEDREDVITIHMEGDVIGGPDAASLTEKIRGFISDNKKKFIIDMKSVNWMNSSGLGILIGCLTTVRNNNGKMCLIRVPKKVKDILKLTKLERVFEIYEDEKNAIEKIT